MPDKKTGVGVGIMILKDGKILLGKRNDDAEKASSLLHGEGTWTMPGGKFHFGETLAEAAAREVLEETGIKIKNPKAISVSDDIVSDAHFVTIGFLVTEFEGEPKAMEPDEITEWKWFELGNLPAKIFFPSRKVLENYKDKIIYRS